MACCAKRKISFQSKDYQKIYQNVKSKNLLLRNCVPFVKGTYFTRVVLVKIATKLTRKKFKILN